jgi:hypothetical protein
VPAKRAASPTKALADGVGAGFIDDMDKSFRGKIMRRASTVLITMLLLLPPAAGGGKTTVTLDGLKSEAPASWKVQEPSNKFRAYQFALPKASGDKEDAELVIFYFGEGGGGGVADNLKRWKGMFTAPEGKSIDDASKVEKLKIGNVEATYLDVQGTYLHKFPPFDPNAKITKKENFRRLGVVFASEKGPYFITVTGPAKTVESQKKSFDDWLKAFK